MMARCVLCASEVASPPKYCPHCGAPWAEVLDAPDPIIGSAVADRYIVEALISTGGMGRVYRATQQVLDRSVAVKIIDPKTLSAKHAADLTARFMTEARAASRLNHPNVVSIFDFGRTSPAPHAPLFLAMALLAGPSLADVLDSTIGPMALPRVVSILRQTLAALGEAHHLGITHRDVKPANIVLQRRQSDTEHVTVIDFGVARIGSDRRVTGRGELLGTPHYMAPELILDDASGPSVDLYAVGIILYEMLTGRVPFDADTALRVCHMQASAPRPDPRELAPNVPDALAEVCLRAIAVDPKARYEGAQALAEAIANAASIPITRAQASVFPQRVPTNAATQPRPPSAPRVSEPAKRRSKSDQPAAAPPEAPEMPLVAREDAMAWAHERLADPTVRSIVIWGKTGCGRTRMLGELAAHAAKARAEVLDASAEPGPRNEVGYTHARALVARLTGLEARDSRLIGGHAADDRAASAGLREMFGAPGTTLATEPGEVRASVVAALAWAARKAVARAIGRSVVVVVDDVDRIDGISRACLWDLVKGAEVPGLVVIASSETEPPPASPGVHSREIHGFTRAEIAELVSPTSRGGDRASLPDAKVATRRVEPLYLEQYRRWRAERRSEKAPTGLREIIEARINELDPAPRRVLQALGVGGTCSRDALARLLERDDGLDDAMRTLQEAGFTVVRGGETRVLHDVYARVALENAPTGVVAHLHARAADVLAAAPLDVERRAFHRLRASPDPEAFALIEKSARLRSLRGDVVQSVAALSDAYAIARRMVARGDLEGGAWPLLGRKLGSALRDAGRADQARGVLVEVLQALGPTDPARVGVVRDLASLASDGGHRDEAERWTREETATRNAMSTSSSRMRSATRYSQPRVPTTASKRPPSMPAPRASARPSQGPARATVPPKSGRTMVTRTRSSAPPKEAPTRVSRRKIEDERGIEVRDTEEADRKGSKRS